MRDLDQHLRSLHAALHDADDLGYFGPESALWIVSREAVLALGLARALSLQIAHPWVAQAVHDHSSVDTNPLERLVATAISGELLVFGSRAQADETAAGIRAIHTRVRGTLSEDVGRWRRGDEYRADDPDALLWVLVTLLDTSLLIYELCFGRLPQRIVSAYLRDGARLGAMVGVPAERVPADRRELRRYIDAMLADGTVAVGTVGLGLAQALYGSPLVQGSSRLWRTYRELSVALARSTLPPALQLHFGVVRSRRERLAHQLAGRAAGLLLPRLPDGLRVDPLTLRIIRRAEVLAREGLIA